ncbi:hypothetical protein HCN44_006472 [Aphidius gifuensis]|uniref:GPI ethanolamine phosphate transferase 3 n=1 Tax=Aphidius gifuensis TaxID=684658 RepID=A0A834Y0A9_APHGI|nr:GPI ethanolamine phosphate transferase 3 [Aphidius gifuensis]KAF7995365.1 hypothetical protein HCN44_006472 [Aphidius gifuensis]
MNNKVWSYLIFLAWMSYLMSSGLLLFINGFFLTRISRNEKNNCTSCRNWKTCNIEDILNDKKNSDNICPEQRGRVVLLIVDALKYDFLNWQNDTKHPTSSSSSYHLNKVPIVNELLNKQPKNSRLYKSIADPPTTTMQRIKAFTTGTLPTFIDIGSNFASEEITEDNIIDQNKNNGIVFMGDDTWTNLYPGKFLRQFPSPSFNVWDLDTVDREVKNRIFFELQKTDWSLIIAHTLGVDHCGHKHGQNHPEMTRKLNETNELIKEIIDVINDDTVLFVMGDHGMTESGDHGGDSSNEIDTALFIYSKKQLQDNNPTFSQSKIVNQIDIVPTISTILGSPIPFSNIGSIIIDALPKYRNKTIITDHPWYTLQSTWKNVIQAKNYIDAYSADSSLFDQDKLDKLNDLFNKINNEKSQVINHNNIDNYLKYTKEYFKLIRDSCVEIWAQFDTKLMSQGLLLMSCTIFFIYIFITGISEERMNNIFTSTFLLITISLNIITSGTIYLLYFINIIDEFKNNQMFLNGAVSMLCLVILVIQNWDVITTTWYNNTKYKKINYLVRVILLLTFCGLFTNSYIIEEDKVLSFLLITLIWIIIYSISDDKTDNIDKKNRSTKTTIKYRKKIILIIIGFIISLSIRLSTYFWRCREEQIRDSCQLFGKIGSINSSSYDRILLITTIILLSLYIVVIRIWLRNCGNLSGLSPSVMLARYCPIVIVVCIGSYWVLQRLPKDSKVKFTLSWQMNALPQVVYILIITTIIVLFIKPLKVFLLPKQRESFNIYQGENVVPQLYDKVKKLFYNKKQHDNNHTNNHDNNNDVPIVYGLGTVYSAAFISFSLLLTLLFALLLGNILASSTVIMTITGACVLAIVAIERFRNANDSNELLQIPSSSIFCWFLIAEYYFYGTGHQPTFPTIYWDAAFIGTGGHFYGNLIPALLIGINTFGSSIILGITLPLLVIAPFTIFVMIPKIAKLKFKADNDMKRGELVLFDKESSFHHSIFVVCVKYILFHAFRTFGCMLSATVHCRHLMVWKIFAPKLIFQGLGFLVTLSSILITYFFVIRIDRQVERLIARVTKNR